LSAASGLPISLAPLQTALFGPSALIAGTSSQAQAVIAVGMTLNAINGQIMQSSGSVSAPLGAGSGLDSLIHTFGSVVADTGALAAAVTARSYVGRIGVNLDESSN
jgi:hypothetical protein